MGDSGTKNHTGSGSLDGEKKGNELACKRPRGVERKTARERERGGVGEESERKGHDRFPMRVLESGIKKSI